MAGGKETPRQKMIGMMYLVLTALLALNVSKEIINAFVKLDSKLQEGNRILVNRNEGIMLEFDKARATEMLGKVPENESEVIRWRKVAEEIRKSAFELDRFINLECKNRMLKEVEGKDFVNVDEKNMRIQFSNLQEVETKDEYDVPSRLFGGEPGTDGFKFGAEIRNRIHRFRDEICQKAAAYEYEGKKYSFDPKKVSDTVSLAKELEEHVYPEDRERIKIIYSSLTLPEKIKEYETEMEWQLSMFDHVPIVAAAALFTSISNDIRASEAQALEILLSRVKVPPFIINTIEPMAFAPSSYLNVGDSMNIRVMIAAYDSNQVNSIRFVVNDSSSSAYQTVNGAIPVKATTPGEYTLFGQISVKEKGIEKWKPWQYRYTVGQPQGVVANEDFTIIYEGYDHTFSASVSGYPQESISLSVPGAAVTPAGNGKFKVKMGLNNVGRQVASTINVRTDQGVKSMPGPKFLVKKLPKPAAFFGSIGGDVAEITVAQLRSNLSVGVRASYGPDVPLDPSKVRYSVTGFEMEVIVNGQPVRKNSSSGQFTTDMVTIAQAIRPGMRLNITNIRATGPTGPVRLSGLSFRVR